jgi:uncharacterized repeat protein (TIGR02543 family)
MRRLLLLLSLITVLVSNVSAQFTTDGFYRVQNYGTKRYLYLTDNTGSYDMKRDIGDFGALQLFKGQEKTLSDPASILYIKKYGSQVDIQGQGVGIYKIVSRYVDLTYVSSGAFKGTYQVSATEAGISKYLDDEETATGIEDGVVGTNRGAPYRNWLIHPVNSSTENYFGITPLFSVNGKYYYPFYAAFPFKTASAGMKIYKIGKYDVELGCAVLSEVTGIVPANSPVLIECTSDSPSNNRLDLIDTSVSPLSENCLSGVYFCNYERRSKSSAAITAFNASNMRVLGITSQGKLGFVTNTQHLNQIEGSYYLRANTSFMYVPANCPTELTAVTEAEYNQIVANRTYTITYMLDGKVYKTEQLKAGQTVNAETPAREGYTFSGWSGLPSTMPAQNITVTGSFTLNSYNITYYLDGVVYKVVSVPYGSTIAPLEVTKTGYVFSGWSGLPSTMPAHDIIVTGSLTIGSYKLTYVIDGVVYQTQTLTYGTAITPLANPTRDGYTFNGWSTIPATMPANDVTITGSFTPIVYTLQYMVDGSLYQQQQVPCGQTITPPTPPEKEGYTFKEWSNLPSAMPAGDLTVTAVYEANKYNLIYVVDGVTYKILEVAYKTVLTPIEAPVKEGHIFSGWSQMPTTMPANDVTVTGTFKKGTYTLEYILNGAGYKDYVYYSGSYQYGQTIVPYSRTPRAIAGYTFSGWDEIPGKMPGHDVKIHGTYKGNNYTITYMIDGVLYQKVTVACGDSIPELTPTKTGYTFSGWKNLPATMPANNITITGQFSINSYILKYIVEIGEKGGTQLLQSYRYTYGAEIKALTSAPSRIGYTFMGWEDVPATMPPYDITVRGKYKANMYKVNYYIGTELVHQQEVAYEDSIPAYTYFSDNFVVSDEDWQGTRYITMPAQDITYNSPQEFVDRLNALAVEEEEGKMIFDFSGRRLPAMKAKGLYIVNGKKILKQ